MSYYKNRGACEYMGCLCPRHILMPNTEKCIVCKHGSCWHKKIKPNPITNSNQFESTRQSATRPIYICQYVERPPPITSQRNFRYFNDSIPMARCIPIPSYIPIVNAIEVVNGNQRERNLENLPV